MRTDFFCPSLFYWHVRTGRCDYFIRMHQNRRGASLDTWQTCSAAPRLATVLCSTDVVVSSRPTSLQLSTYADMLLVSHEVGVRTRPYRGSSDMRRTCCRKLSPTESSGQEPTSQGADDHPHRTSHRSDPSSIRNRRTACRASLASQSTSPQEQLALFL